MQSFYFTFGQDHRHKVRGKEFNRDTVVRIVAEDQGTAREVMFDWFKDKWSMQYSELPNMDYFPGGVIDL